MPKLLCIVNVLFDGFISDMVNTVKFQTLFFSFFSQIKCWLLELGIKIYLSKWQIRKTLIRLLQKKQSDLGLPCLFRPLKWATSIHNS